MTRAKEVGKPSAAQRKRRAQYYGYSPVTLSPKSEVDDTTIQPRVYDGKTKPRIPGFEDAGR